MKCYQVKYEDPVVPNIVTEHKTILVNQCDIQHVLKQLKVVDFEFIGIVANAEEIDNIKKITESR